jgi:hypothetical protein
MVASDAVRSTSSPRERIPAREALRRDPSGFPVGGSRPTAPRHT